MDDLPFDATMVYSSMETFHECLAKAQNIPYTATEDFVRLNMAADFTLDCITDLDEILANQNLSHLQDLDTEIKAIDSYKGIRRDVINGKAQQEIKKLATVLTSNSNSLIMDTFEDACIAGINILNSYKDASLYDAGYLSSLDGKARTLKMRALK